MPTSSSSLTFGAFFAYAPGGTSDVSRQGLVVRDKIKYKADSEFLRRASDMIAGHLDDYLDFFGQGVTLVPAPRSAPLQKGWLWPGDRIAQALAAAGLGGLVDHLLERVRAVPKAATSAPADRPTINDHRTSIKVVRMLHTPERIVIVDDVITRGTMLYACAGLLRDEFPEADIRVFALLRTMSWLLDVSRVIDPYVGTIVPNSWGDYTDRSDYLQR